MLKNLRKSIRAIPVLGPLLARKFGRGNVPFTTSSEYWEARYRTGGTSGAGSYNRLAIFKADFLNDFVEKHAIKSVIEYGSGDGAQLKLARYPDYTGVDVSGKAVEMCRRKFVGDTSKRFYQSPEVPPNMIADMTLSLDVIYHLVEDQIYNSYMWQLFGSASRFVIVYSSNTDKETEADHVRHRQFTRWVEQNEPEWSLQATTSNIFPYNPADQENTSFADFFVFSRR